MGITNRFTICGNFTMLKYIDRLNGAELERRLGYHAGRLKSPGFMIVILSPEKILGADDFEMKPSTGWAKGMMRGGVDIADMLQLRGINSEGQRKLREKIACKFQQRAGFTPAKVLPNLLHDDAFQYPAAELLGPGLRVGVPQFNIPKSKEQPFVLLRAVHAGH